MTSLYATLAVIALLLVAVGALALRFWWGNRHLRRAVEASAERAKATEAHAVERAAAAETREVTEAVRDHNAARSDAAALEAEAERVRAQGVLEWVNGGKS
jgi:DNA-binding transcriptional regulator WhiA